MPGATHDKTLCDGVRTLDRLPDGAAADADKGYQGLAARVECVAVCEVATRAERQVPRLMVQTPHKKPRGGELTTEQRQDNHRLGSRHIRVEHCIGWLKNGPSSPRVSVAPTRSTPPSCGRCVAWSTPKPRAGKPRGPHRALILNRV